MPALPHQPNVQNQRIPLQAPKSEDPLLLADPLRPKGRAHLLDLPDEIDDVHCFVGAYKSWLLICHEQDSALFLFNPFSGSRIPLPTKNICSITLKKLVFSSTPVDQSCVFMAIHGSTKKLTYCRPGAESWVFVNDGGNDCFIDLMCYEGQFYALGQKGSVLKIGFSGDSVSVNRIRLVDVDYDEYSGKKYLVGSSGKLLLIEKDWANRGGVFCVFEYDERRRDWVEQSNLDGCAVFVGENYTVSLSPLDAAGCGADCVYFADFFKNFPVVFHRVAAFYLNDGTIEHLSHGQGILDHGMTYLPEEAVWVTPSLT